MKKDSIHKKKKHQQRRSRREMRRRSKSYVLRRKRRLQNRLLGIIQQRRFDEKPYEVIDAPHNFSFIDNTDEVLSYFNKCKKLLHSNEKVECNISKITSLSADAIALLAACANDRLFLGKRGKIRGNAPVDKILLQTFIESGFYNHVNCESKLKNAQRQDKNLFHKESHLSVQADLAKKACLLGIKHVFNNEKPLPDLYEMLVEAMSNTNNHANCDDTSKQVKWWLYTYNNPNGCTMYTFIDLGVGIFDSRPVQLYKRIKKYFGLEHNADLVPDLLAGRIKSREKIDNEIRGKGIPQIAENSKNKNISRAYIVSNNVKINLKDGTAEKLSSDFSGTLLFWELANNN